MLLYIIYKLIQHNTGCKTVHALCELHLDWFRDKLLYDFDYVSHQGNMLQAVYQEIHSNYLFHKQIHI